MEWMRDGIDGYVAEMEYTILKINNALVVNFTTCAAQDVRVQNNTPSNGGYWALLTEVEMET